MDKDPYKRQSRTSLTARLVEISSGHKEAEGSNDKVPANAASSVSSSGDSTEGNPEVEVNTSLNSKHEVCYLPSVKRDVPYQGKVMYLTQEEIQQKCRPSKFNTRSAEHISMADVLDIYPSIAESKVNKKAAVGMVRGDYISIAEGLRRMFCISTGPADSVFKVEVYSDVDWEDELAHARVADIYSKPGPLDEGEKFNALIEQSKEEAKRLNDRTKVLTKAKVAKMYEVSEGMVTETTNFTKIPKYIIDCLPGYRFVTYKWLREVYKLRERFDDEMVKQKLKQLRDQNSTVVYDDLGAAEEASKVIRSQILKVLSTKQQPAKQTESDNPWYLLEMDGVSVNRRQQVILDLKTLDEKVQRKIIDVLENHND